MTYLPDERVKWLVIHYSATPIERDVTGVEIDRMHRARGFRKIGYQYYLRKNGTVELGRDMSRPGFFEVGAHVLGRNEEAIGICFEGGVTEADPNKGFDSRTPQQIRAMIKLIDVLRDRFPNARVEGHRDMPGAATQCPGFDAAAWWAGIEAGRRRPPWMRRIWKRLFRGAPAHV